MYYSILYCRYPVFMPRCPGLCGEPLQYSTRSRIRIRLESQLWQRPSHPKLARRSFSLSTVVCDWLPLPLCYVETLPFNAVAAWHSPFKSYAKELSWWKPPPAKSALCPMNSLERILIWCSHFPDLRAWVLSYLIWVPIQCPCHNPRPDKQSRQPGKVWYNYSTRQSGLSSLSSLDLVSLNSPD